MRDLFNHLPLLWPYYSYSHKRAAPGEQTPEVFVVVMGVVGLAADGGIGGAVVVVMMVTAHVALTGLVGGDGNCTSRTDGGDGSHKTRSASTTTGETYPVYIPSPGSGGSVGVLHTGSKHSWCTVIRQVLITILTLFDLWWRAVVRATKNSVGVWSDRE